MISNRVLRFPLLVIATLCMLFACTLLIAQEEVVFSDDFESGTLGNATTGTWQIGTASWFTQEFVYDNTHNHTGGGSKSAYSLGYDSGSGLDGIGAWNDPQWGPITNGRADVWFYDDMVSPKNQYASLDNSAGSRGLGMMVRTTNMGGGGGTSTTKYVLFRALPGLSYTVTNFDRTAGWHKVSWVRDSTNQTYLYLDDVLVYTAAAGTLNNFADFDLGSWNWDSNNTNTKAWFDDIKVVRGQHQSRYRWYQDDSAETPTALAGENTAYTMPNNTMTLRLRAQLRNEMSISWSGSRVALRYREGTGGTWTDLGASAHWQYADGMGINANQVANALLTNTNVREHFAEQKPSAAMNTMTSNQYGEWDLPITPTGNVTKGQAYYFKLVEVNAGGSYLTDFVSYPYLAQVTTYASKRWDGSVSTAWNNANNWTPAGVPTSADDVTIPTGVPRWPQLNMNATGANAIASLTVVSGAQLRLNNTTAYTLDISGNAVFGGTITHTTATVNVSGTAITVAGTYNHTGAGDLIGNIASTMTVQSGATYTMSGAAGNVSSANLDVSGTYIQQTNDNTLTAINITVNNGGEFRNTRISAGSLIDIYGTFTNNGTMSNTTGGFFRFSGASCGIAGSSTTTQFGAIQVISGTTTISASSIPAFTSYYDVILNAGTSLSAASKTIHVGRYWTNNGGTFSGSSSTVKFNGGMAGLIDNGSAQTTFQNVESAKNAGINLTASRALDINGNFSLTSGNFVPSTFVHNVAGNWSDSGGNFVPAAGTLILDGVAPTVTTAAGNNFYNVTVSTSGTATMGASELDVNNNLVISSGATLNSGSSANSDVLGTTSITGTLEPGTGAINLRGAVTVNSGGTLKLQSSGGLAPTVRLGNGAVGGSITIASGGGLESGGSPYPTLTRQGTANYALTAQSGSTVNLDGITIDRPNNSGLNIADGATITKLYSTVFTNGSAAAGTYLNIGATSGAYTFRFCNFDANCLYNVAVPAGTATITMNDAMGARGASPAGENNDNDPGDGGVPVEGRIQWLYGKLWTGAVNTAWNNTGNWLGGAIPVSTDDVVIPTYGVSNWPQLNMNATGANRVKSFFLLAGATLNLNNGTAYSLQIDNDAEFAGTVTHTTAAVNVSGSSVTISGNYNHTGAGDFTSAAATTTISSSGIYTMSGNAGNVTASTLDIDGTFIQGTNNNTLTVTDLTINSGGEFRNTRANASSIIDIAGKLTNNGVMASTTGGHFCFSGGSSEIAGTSADTRFWRPRIVSGTTTITATGDPAFTVLDDLYLDSGATLSSTGKTFELQNGWVNNGGTFSGSGSTCRFKGTAATIDTGSAQTTFQNLDVDMNTGVALTAGRGLDINGNFTLNTGEFIPSTYTHTVAGNWDDSNGKFQPAAGSIVIDGTDQNVTTAAINNFYNLTVSNSGTASMGSSEMDINNNLSISASGTLNCGSSMANDVVGTTSISGTLDAGTSTLTLRGAVTVNNLGTFNLVTSSSAPTVQLGNGAAAGSLTIASGGTVYGSGSPRPLLTRQGTANYSFTIQSGGIVNIDSLTVDYPNNSGLNIANGATITMLNNVAFTNGSGAAGTYLTLGSLSGTYTFRFCDFDTNCQYNVFAPAGGSLAVTMDSATGAKGASPNGEANDNDTANRVTWAYGKTWTGTTSTNWSTGTNWSDGIAPTNADDVVIPDASNDPVLTANSAVREIYITTGSLNIANLTLQPYGNLIVESTGNITNSGGRIAFRGNAAQDFKAPTVTFNNVRINKTGGTVTVDSNLDIDGTLDFWAGQSGTLDPESYNINLASDLTVTAGTLSAATATWTMDGSGNTIVSGAGTITFNNLTANKSGAGTVTLQNTVTVSGTLRLDSDITASGTLNMVPGSTVMMTNGSTLTASGASTFTADGTAWTSGNYIHITSPSAGNSYTVDLQGNVTLDYVQLDNASHQGLKLNGSGGATVSAANVRMNNISTGGTYLLISGTDWDSYRFSGWGFDDVTGATEVTAEITSGGRVLMESYETGGGYLFGEDTDIDTSGKVMWAVTAAMIDDLKATPGADGVTVSWRSATEFNNAGYQVYRRELGDAEADSAHLAVEPDMFGVPLNDKLIRGSELGSSQEQKYLFVDTSAEAGRSYSYLVTDVDLGGNISSRLSPVMVQMPGITPPALATILLQPILVKTPVTFRKSAGSRQAVPLSWILLVGMAALNLFCIARLCRRFKKRTACTVLLILALLLPLGFAAQQNRRIGGRIEQLINVVTEFGRDTYASITGSRPEHERRITPPTLDIPDKQSQLADSADKPDGRATLVSFIKRYKQKKSQLQTGTVSTTKKKHASSGASSGNGARGNAPPKFSFPEEPRSLAELAKEKGIDISGTDLPTSFADRSRKNLLNLNNHSTPEADEQTPPVASEVNPGVVFKKKAAQLPWALSSLVPADAMLLKITTFGEGLYRLSGNTLDSYGYNLSKPFVLVHKSGYVQLFPVAGTSDLCFYGAKYSSLYSDKNTYWLWQQKQKVKFAEGSGSSSKNVLVEYEAVIRLEENGSYRGNLPDSTAEDDHFFHQLYVMGGQSRDFALTCPDALTTKAGTVRLKLRSYSPTTPSSHIKVLVNGVEVGQYVWSGARSVAIEATVPAGTLNAGNNTVTISSFGDTGAAIEATFVDWIELRYQRPFIATGDKLAFDTTVSGKVTVTGLTTDKVMAVRTDSSPAQSISKIEVAAGTATFSVEGNARYVVTDTTALLSPHDVKSANHVADANSLSCNYLIITTDALVNAADQFAVFHRSKGRSVKVLTLADALNAGDWGLYGPDALKETLRLSGASYLLLVGDMTFDYFGLYTRDVDYALPAPFIVTQDYHAVSDYAYSLVNGGVAVGRIPARTEAEVEAVLDKVKKRPGSYAHKLTAVADAGSAQFLNSAEHMASQVSGNVVQIDMAKTGLAASKAALFAAWDDGTRFVTFSGHGSPTQWSQQRILQISDIPLLAPLKPLPIVIQLNCFSNAAQRPQPAGYSCIGEALLLIDGCGASAVIGSTAMTPPKGQQQLGGSILNEMDTYGMNVGQALLRTQQKLRAAGADQDVIKSFILLGDPAAY